MAGIDFKGVMMKKLLGLVLAGLMLIGCGASGTPYFKYHNVGKVDHNYVEVIPVDIDSRFSAEQVDSIKAAATEMNNALNGFIVIKINEKHFATTDDGLRLLMADRKKHEGWVLLDLDSDDPLLSDVVTPGDGTLAFVSGASGHLLVVVRDQIGVGRDIKTIILHEFSHFLGAQHVNAPSLMNPFYSASQYNCVDKMTLAQIASYNNLDLNELNYCATPNFE